VTVRFGRRAQTLKLNAITTAALAVALLPAMAGGGVIALVLALMLSAGPRAVISTIAYSLASGHDADDGGSDGVVFGMLNGAWAAATVLMPLVAGAVEGVAGPDVAYLAVVIPSLAVAACLMAGAAERVPALRVGLRGWR
jgi:MFS family permease